jgi:hypothetical protein
MALAEMVRTGNGFMGKLTWNNAKLSQTDCKSRVYESNCAGLIPYQPIKPYQSIHKYKALSP